MLEYFEGVLFLTSNRKEVLDDAFLSRIHLTINLPELSNKERAAIWSKMVQSNSQPTQDAPWTSEMFTVLGKLDINVRSTLFLLY